jgi:flagellar motor component MotA
LEKEQQQTVAVLLHVAKGSSVLRLMSTGNSSFTIRNFVYEEWHQANMQSKKNRGNWKEVGKLQQTI